MHQSTITSILEGCSLQWGLTNLLGLEDPPKPASTAGTAFHTAVERHELARKEYWDSDGERGNHEGMPVEEMEAIITTELDKVVGEIPSRHYPTNKKTGEVLTPEGVYKMARAALYAWYSKPSKETGVPARDWLMDYKPLEIEPYFKNPVVEGALPLGGWADGVYQHLETGKVIIVDEKTASDSSFGRWNAAEHWLQATMYTVLALLDGRFPVQSLDELEFWFLVNRTTVGKTASFTRSKHLVYQATMQDVQRLGDQVRETQHVIDTKDFKPNATWGALCSETYCPFWAQCMGAPNGNGKFRKVWVELEKEYT